MANTNRETAVALKRALRVDVFSEEYEILALLHEADDVAHRDISGLLGAPPATFERRLGLLTSKNLIQASRDSADGRRRRYALTRHARQILDEELAFFTNWPSHEKDAAGAIAELVANLRNRLAIKIFAQEYRVALSLYRNGGERTLSLLTLAQVSHGSFFSKLRNLKAAGIIQSARHVGDGREVQLFLSDWATKAIDDAHADLNAWASSQQRLNR